MKVNIDETDLSLLLYFLEGEGDFTVVDIVKDLFNPEDRHALIRKVAMITYRLKKWVKKEIFTLTVINGTKYYELNDKNIRYGDSSLIIEDERFETGKAIAIRAKDEEVIVCFLQKTV